MTIRTRFAPSPTGFLHVGGIRTALFAYLVARQSGGEFILRFEDTDKKREVAGSAEHLISSLKAIGIDYDEGPDIGGPFAPYIQSQRLDHYKQWAQKLIDAGRAYADPYTSEEIQAFRDEAMANKRAFRYRDYRPENPPAWDGSQPLRFKSEPKPYSYHDEVMGDITTSPEVIDDIILMKSDGYPTYNFAHIVDDTEMEITHIIRGQEFISSMPNYLALYEALGVAVPVLAHMPHIMNEQGNKKLGKRDGAKDVLDYIRDGYLPETMMSFIATMGWNDGTEQEVFTKDELVEKFNLDRVQRSGARFDEKRLLWMNGHFIRELPLDELSGRIEYFWPESAKKHPENYKKQVLALAQDRLKTFKDLPGLTSYFFEEPNVDMSLITGNKQLAKLEPAELKTLLQTALSELSALKTWNAETIQECLNTLLEKTGQKPGILFSLIRIATTWAPFSPQLNDTLALLGKDTTPARLEVAIKSL
ncbi:glutamate--tRNA ligase [Candidatus Saccharibacteria bacterium]|nr:glutamate--tRNA ligase [Candidatus Saccharibacteria bacterium]